MQADLDRVAADLPDDRHDWERVQEEIFAASGYRYFAVDYKNGGFLYNVHMNGPVVGFNLHYK